MRIIVGIILYKSDLDVLVKNIQMFSCQSLLSGDNAVDVSVIILDNDMGGQLPKVRDILEKHISGGFSRNIVYISSENIGFGAGHNRIFALARQEGDFDYYLCANPDGIPHREMLGGMVSFAKKNNDHGIFEARQFPVEHPKVYDQLTGKTAWCSGCCLMFPKAVFERLGGFDEFFFMYMEDVDISWRAKLLGYGCYTVHDALFFHHVDYDDKNREQMTRNMSISGYKLGSKYKAPVFRKQCLERLHKLLTDKELTSLEREISTKGDEYRQFKAEKFMNFKTGFHFSAVRW